jgi:hypothetical protein
MVRNANRHSGAAVRRSRSFRSDSGAYKIGASTGYDFEAHNLTVYGGLLPLTTMLEKLGFQQMIAEILIIHRQTRSMPVFEFILGMILACYVCFSGLHSLRFLKREPTLTGVF